MAGPADIPFQSALPQFTTLLQTLIGNQVKGSSSSTATTKGDTGALEALLATISDPNNLTNLVSDLFAKGAAQVPGLTQQFANSTGTRVTNNSMLGQSLAQLNQTLASSIATAIQQQQQLQGSVAGKIADSNKTVRTQGQTMTATAPSTARTLGIAGFPTALGFALNKSDKIKELFAGKVDTAPVDITSSIPSTFGGPAVDPFGGYPNAGAFSFGGGSDIGAVDFSAPASAAVSTAFDAADGVGIDALGADFNSGFDFGSSGVDFGGGGGDFLDDAFDFGGGGDGGGFIDDIFDFGGGDWFADGGRIRYLPAATRLNIRMAAKRRGVVESGGNVKRFANGGPVVKQKSYADGGAVIRNKPNFGTPTPVMGTGAISFSPEELQERIGGTAGAGANLNSDALLQMITNIQQNQQQGSGNPTAAMGPSVPGTPGSSIPGFPSAFSAGKAALSIAMGHPVAAVIGLLINALTNSISTDPGEDAGTMGAEVGGFLGTEGVGTTDSISTDPGEDAGTTAGSVTVGSIGDQAAVGVMGAIGADDAVSVGADVDAAVAAEGGVPGSSIGVSTGDEGSSSDSGDGGDSGGFAEGGTVKAKSKKQRGGIDTVPILATEGEYMIPVDVADFIGRDVLDELVASVHIPVRTGTHG